MNGQASRTTATSPGTYCGREKLPRTSLWKGRDCDPTSESARPRSEYNLLKGKRHIGPGALESLLERPSYRHVCCVIPARSKMQHQRDYDPVASQFSTSHARGRNVNSKPTTVR